MGMSWRAPQLLLASSITEVTKQSLMLKFKWLFNPFTIENELTSVRLEHYKALSASSWKHFGLRDVMSNSQPLPMQINCTAGQLLLPWDPGCIVSQLGSLQDGEFLALAMAIKKLSSLHEALEIWTTLGEILLCWSLEWHSNRPEMLVTVKIHIDPLRTAKFILWWATSVFSQINRTE